MEIGARLRGLRTAAGMSQDDLAARVYVSRQTISSWENGRTYPDVQSLLLSLAAVTWLAVQCSVWGWGLGHALPTLLLALVLWGGAMFASVWAERIKRDHDLVTYREVVDFWEGREVNRDTERGRRERALPGWMRTVRTVGMVLLAAAAGFLCSRYGLPLLRALFG